MSRGEKKDSMTAGALVRDALLWVFSLFCLLSSFVFMPSLSAFLLLFVAIASMPIKPVRSAWAVLPSKLRFVKPLLLTILFLVAVLVAPIPEPVENPGAVVTDDIVAEDGDVLAEGSADHAGKSESSNEVADKDATDNAENDAKDHADKDATQQLDSQVTEEIAEGIPAYSGSMFAVINDNVPFFTEKEMTATSYESYSPLDELGRCGVCVASIGKDIMPTEDRGDIGSVKPSGWKQVKYSGLVDGSYLYNRAHLIGHQLTGEDANECNLITGTRYFNTEGMLPFENMVADYVKETGNHVMYRVTPVFEGDNLVASGVLMEAKSVEDDGEGILFCVFCYNVQPGIYIDYRDGSSCLQEDADVAQKDETTQSQDPAKNYAVNDQNGKIHKVGACYATGDGDNAMDNPVYFATYEDALAYSEKIAPKEKNRDCGHCW